MTNMGSRIVLFGFFLIAVGSAFAQVYGPSQAQAQTYEGTETREFRHLRKLAEKAIEAEKKLPGALSDVKIALGRVNSPLAGQDNEWFSVSFLEMERAAKVLADRRDEVQTALDTAQKYYDQKFTKMSWRERDSYKAWKEEILEDNSKNVVSPEMQRDIDAARARHKRLEESKSKK